MDDTSAPRFDAAADVRRLAALERAPQSRQDGRSVADSLLHGGASPGR